jgi:hypothetical protein
MKNLLILFCLFIFGSMLATAQDYTVSNSMVLTAKGATGDTVIKNGYKDYTLYIPTFATDVKVQILSTNVRGKSKTKTVVMSSLDNKYWVRIDSTTLNGNGYYIVAKSQPYANYIKLRTTQIDSTGTTRFKYNILIRKE